MSKIGFINGSPRSKNSLSTNMISYFCQLPMFQGNEPIILNAYKLSFEKNIASECAALLDCSTIIIVSPLYADSLPSTLLNFLRKLELYSRSFNKSNTPPPILYGFINCGFLEGTQNHIALNILANYASSMHWDWGGGLGLGGGEMFKGTRDAVPKQSKMMRPVYETLDLFNKCITNNAPIPTPNKQLLVNQNFPKFAFIQMANLGWIPSAWQYKVNLFRMFHKPYL